MAGKTEISSLSNYNPPLLSDPLGCAQKGVTSSTCPVVSQPERVQNPGRPCLKHLLFQERQSRPGSTPRQEGACSPGGPQLHFCIPEQVLSSTWDLLAPHPGTHGYASLLAVTTLVRKNKIISPTPLRECKFVRPL